MNVCSRLFASALLIAGMATLNAQDRPATSEGVEALRKKFEAERAVAVGQKFPAHSLDLSDQLAERGRAGAEKDSFQEAL
jgi:hypothetical protein